MTDFALIAARAVHFGASMLLFGELLFAFGITAHSPRNAVAPLSHGFGGDESRLRTVIAWALAVSAVSSATWLALEVASMTGSPLQALDLGTMTLVLRESVFGHWWCVRIALLAILVVASLSLRTTNDARRRWATLVAVAVSAIYLATLAFAGHAAASQGAGRVVHLASDASHALAAGAWVGALPAFVAFLRSGRASAVLARGTRVFSLIGISSVAVLLASGIVNACFLVRSFPALFGTAYGLLLIAKLVLFGAMLSIATVNRLSLTPRLAVEHGVAALLLRRNATLEIVGGVLIVGIAGALGTMIPAAHQSPVWPFSFTLDPSLQDVGRYGRFALMASAAIAIAALLLMVSGVRRRGRPSCVAGSLGLLAAIAVSLWVLAIPAFPTTYAVSQVPYRVDEVARGGASFARNCSGCHGAEARGDGPLAATLPDKPADLGRHVPAHPEGNLFWWIAHGIPDSGMPPFSPRLSDTEIWEVVQWLAARSAAEGSSTISPAGQREPRFRVPDFAYEAREPGQQTLLQQSSPVVIVLYELPQSAGRLASLDADERLVRAKVRILAIPAGLTQRADGDGGSFVRFVSDPNVASVYAMFAGRPQGAAPVHTELLVDRAGFLRARWIGVPASEGDQTAAVVAQAEHLKVESTAVRAPVHRMH